MLFVQETHAKSGSALLLDLPEKHASTDFGSRLPHVRGQRRVEASKFRFQSGLSSCRVHALSEFIRFHGLPAGNEGEIMRAPAQLHQGL
ncbi:MAG TPA: hypothetical protein VFY42_07455 [Gemmatimonadales bacterium]|nr:hypothetical protein [Gemmatimonadales bacterium]